MNKMKRSKPALKNRILTVAGTALLVALSVFSIQKTFVSAVALEQTARCGAEEHHHETDCYADGKLNCGQKEHTHNRNCYLVLLKDNDINNLLSHIDNDKSHSLEMLIHRAVDTAILYNENLYRADKEAASGNEVVFLSNAAINSTPKEAAITAQEEPIKSTQVEYSTLAQTSVQEMDISELNETISENKIEPNIVLNENLYNAAAVSTAPGDTVVLLDSTGSSGGISTLAVGDSQMDDKYTANFFINLDTDDNWVCIGHLPFKLTTSNNGRYSVRVSTPAIVNLINDSLGTSYTDSSFRLKYAGSAGASSWSNATISSTYTTLGTNIRQQGTAELATYVRVVDTSENDLRFYTVTYEYINGSIATEYIPSGQSAEIPDGKWVSGGETYWSGDTVAITAPTTFQQQAINYCTVTYQYPDSSVIIDDSVAEGTQITLPNGYTWSANGITYNGGELVTINSNTVFTGAVIERTLRIRYTLNFPGSGVMVTPSIVGGSGDQLVTNNSSATIRTVSPRDAGRLPSSSWFGGTAATAYYFVGWTAITAGGATIHISPGANLTAQQLAQYADQNDVVQLTGNWISGAANNSSSRSHVATFFMGKDSEAPDYGENAGPAANPNDYTGCIYTAYVGNPPSDTTFKITDQTPDNSYNVDKEIRALVGEKTDQLWLSSIPSDEEVFAALRPYAEDGEISVEGETVDPDELTSEYYAIRWYVMKFDSGGSSSDNGWHIDGRLVKKEGTIRVTKTFLSEADVLDAAQNGFYIEAVYDDPDGTTDDRTVVMHLGNGTVSAGSAESLTPTAVTGTTYEWHIKHIGVKQEWTISEHILNSANTSALINHTIYSEYSLLDSRGLNESARAEYGSEVSLTGVTQAVDESEQHMLRVDFTNFYLRKDAIALKKEDGSTGAGLPGVRFEMYHLNMDSPLKFSGTAGSYTKDDNGSVTQLETDASGFISISGFSYDRDLVVFREVSPPSGYSKAPEITLQGFDSGNSLSVQIVKVGDKAASSMTQTDLDATAEFHNSEQVLVIKDYSVQETSVTVTKKWAVSEALRPDSVTVELYANGQLATNVIPGLNPVSVALTRDDGYTYTWTNLPAYANGREVTWSVYETAVGNEKRTVNGEFVNWVDSYDPPTYTYVEGHLVNTELVIRNDARRTMLNILKTNEEGTKVLPGAQFRLVGLKQSLVPSGSYDQTLVTDENGRLTFDNLTAGYYLLSEVLPPHGCEATMADTYLYIDASGTVQR